MHVPGGQVGGGSAAVVFVVDAHRPGLAWGQGGVAAAAGLDGGLLIGAEHVLVGAGRLAVEDPAVQVEDPGAFGGEVRVPDEDPGAVLPGLEGVLGQPAAHGGGRDGLHHAMGGGLPG